MVRGVTPVEIHDARDAIDRELLQRGEHEELLAGYVDEIRARCRMYCRSHGEDVAQQVCLRLWSELRAGKHRERKVPFRVIQLQVTRWVCREFGGTVFPSGVELDPGDGPDAGDAAGEVAFRLDLEAFVASLPQGDGEIARLRFVEGREIDEIAAATGKQRNAVDQALFRVRRLMKGWLAP